MQPQPQFLYNDGTSQAGRVRKPLDPAYVSVDERTVGDLLAFAQKYAQELRYFNESNLADGDWSAFLAEIDPGEVAGYLNNPELFQADPAKMELFHRPHFVLFLTFLQLLQYARTQLNDLTRRHLEFYYKEALRLTTHQGAPDHVHILVELADDETQFLLPAGTLLQAGRDSQGSDLFYKTDDDLVANRATVTSLKSLFSQRQTIGIKEAYQLPDLLAELFPVNQAILAEGQLSDRGFMAMLVMALGRPRPGGALAPYPVFDTATVVLNTALLKDLHTLLAFIPANLYMPLSTFRYLMQLKGIQDQMIVTGQWDQVNQYLTTAGQRRDPAFQLDQSEAANFDKNLLAALGLKNFNHFFDVLPEVTDIYGLFRWRDRPDVIAFINGTPSPNGVPGQPLYMTRDEFIAMMTIVEDCNGRWRQIYEILRAASRKIHSQFDPPQIRAYDKNKFDTLVQKTLGTINYPTIFGRQLGSFDDCYAALLHLEGYFHIAAEQFALIRAINAKQAQAQPWEWDQVYSILEDAHSQALLADRRLALQAIRESQGFDAMILFALGDPNPGDPLPLSKQFEKLDTSSNVNNDQGYIRQYLFLDPTNCAYINTIGAKGNSATSDEWSTVYSILEQAQRRKRGWQQPPAEIQNWKNIYVAPDATQVKVTHGAEGDEVTPRWRTFGQGYVADGTSLTTPGDIGFAIASPILMLAEGTRTITLTIDFNEAGFDKESITLALQGSSPFKFLLSSETELLVIEKADLQLLTSDSSAAEKKQSLQIKLSLDQQTPPIMPLASGGNIQTPWPVLQIMLADIPQRNDGSVKSYRAFQNLELEKIHLAVAVDGITSLTIQNDDGLLDPKKPFEPFGAAPVVGSSFYIAHPELCSKQLDQLTLSVDWLGVADNLSVYYLGYLDYRARDVDPNNNPATSPITDNTNFKAQLKLYDNRSFFDIEAIQLFHANADKTSGASSTNLLSINIAQDAAQTNLYANYKPNYYPVSGLEVIDWNRFWQIELLAPDFQHTVYPQVAAGCANKIDKASGAAKPYIVNLPYTPKIKRLSVGYSASLDIDLTISDPALLIDQLYYIEPLGYRELEKDGSQPYPFLPQYDNEGELYIGISNLAPPQNLSLLFQMAEGSADPNLAQETIQWSFLDGNQWRSLDEGQLLSDTTNGLLNSGIIEFSLSPVKPGTLLPSDQYWIRASIVQNSRSIADTIAINAQAVRATFEDQGNALDHLSQPLPSGAITGLAEIQPEVQAIYQPFSSFGGKSPEQPNAFYTRVSERLRHKNRALTCWDYEHMVLDAFPDIYKVKCLPVGASDDPRLANVIQVVVIPDIRGKLPFDPFEPKAPADILLQIEQYLAKHNAPFALFKVKNPSYIRVKVRLGVRLRPDANPGYYKNALNLELQRYLAPWAYDHSAEIVFGGKLNTSLIVNFVEERPYVDYVAGLKLFTSPDGEHYTPYNAPGEAEPGNVSVFPPDAIFVSDHLHQIDLITEEGYQEEYFIGINYMKIELDFQVA